MTLSFTQSINGKPNYFIEKIWYSLYLLNKNHYPEYGTYLMLYKHRFNDFWDAWVWPKEPIGAKLHTIRLDPHNRWRAGMNIHPVINNRTPNRFQFAPTIPCVSVQNIEIKDVTEVLITYKDLNFGWIVKDKVKDAEYYLAYEVFIDGRRLTSEEVKALAINDGFDSEDDFFGYFNKDFTGKIVHWTDLKY